MDVHIIVKLKSSYEDWHEIFAGDGERRSAMCDETRTLVGQASEKTALVTLFNVDMEAMGAMMADPDFQKMAEDYVEEHIPFSLTPIGPPQT